MRPRLSRPLERPGLSETAGLSRVGAAFRPADTLLVFQGVRGMDGPHGPKGSLVSDGQEAPPDP